MNVVDEQFFDIWQYIFKWCQSFQLRVLRRVCRTFKDWLDCDGCKMYFSCLHKECPRGLTFGHYFRRRRRLETRKLERELVSTVPNYVVCNSEKAKSQNFHKQLIYDFLTETGLWKFSTGHERLHLRGLFLINFKPCVKLDLCLGIILKVTIDPNILSYDTQIFNGVLSEWLTCDEQKNVLYFPIFQSGSLRLPEYNILDFFCEDENVKVLYLFDVLDVHNTDGFDINVLFNGKIWSTWYGETFE